jgi:cell division protein ZapA (FtsZ GTPase activity inhibitor)
MATASSATEVEIYGVRYRVRGTDDPEFAETVGRVVDDRMREVAHHSQSANQTQLAVLTMMNLAGELLRERERMLELETTLANRLREIGDRVASALAKGQ